MVRIRVGFQDEREDIGEIGTARFLVDGTLIQIGSLATVAVDGEDVDDRKWGVEDLGRGFDQAGVAPIPTSSIQVQAIDVHAWKINIGDVPKVQMERCGERFDKELIK